MADPDAAGRRAWLGFGGNLGDPAARIAEAVARLGATGLAIRRISGLYRTPPWGEPDQPDFLNAAAEIRTSLSPHDLLETCLSVEQALGRVRARRWGPRVIDVDVLHIDGVNLNEPDLILPHPRLTERAFALVPLAEIAPDLVVAGRSVAAWLAGLDRSGIEPVPTARTVPTAVIPGPRSGARNP